MLPVCSSLFPIISCLHGGTNNVNMKELTKNEKKKKEDDLDILLFNFHGLLLFQYARHTLCLLISRKGKKIKGKENEW